MTTTSKKPHVLIIGAGLGGLTLAQSLRKQGLSFQVFERDESLHARSQGWAIALHTILEQLAKSVPDDLPNLKAYTNHLAPLPLNAQFCVYMEDKRLGVEASEDCDVHRANRQKLRDWLSTNIPIQWGKQLVKVEEESDGVVATFADGTTAVGDIIVGADGINSVVREHILQEPNSTILRNVPISVIVGQLNLSGDAFERQLQLGHSAWVAGSPSSCWNFTGLNQVRPDGQSGDYYWFLSWADDEAGAANHWMKEASKEKKLKVAKEKARVLDPRFSEIVENTTVDGIQSSDFLFRDAEIGDLPISNATLLGDAAHPMAPFRGEGGAHAMRDALLLGEAIGSIQARDKSSIRKKLASYQEELVQRGVAAVARSRGGSENTGQSGNTVFSWGHATKELRDEKIELKDGGTCTKTYAD